MKISILTFDGFNELDSLVAYSVLNRIKDEDWYVQIASPTPEVESMNGLKISRHVNISDGCLADVIVVGSGMKTREVVANSELMAQLRFDLNKQMVVSQCSGTLVLAKLGLLTEAQACTDLTTQPWVEECGVKVLEQPFYATGNLATAGGCLSSVYLACWLIAKTKGLVKAKEALYYIAPVGEKQQYINTMLKNIEPYL